MNDVPVIDMTATGMNITRLRINAGLTVRELQAVFGFSTPQAIYKWQRGEAILEVKAYERAVIRALYEIMTGASDEEIRSAIKKRIPPITDAEIDAYRTNAKER